MANSGRPTYRLNLNRNPTQKWAEAQSVDYGGDDWGDDDEDDGYNQSQYGSNTTGAQRQQAWGQGSGQTTQRSFTNPSLGMGVGRPSHDRDEERRYFSQGGFDPRNQSQPTAMQISQQGPAGRYYGEEIGRLPPSLNTNVYKQPTQSDSWSDPHGNEQTDVYGVPYSAPVGKYSQRLPPDTRTTHPDNYNIGNIQSPWNESSIGSVGAHPPRKSSLSQQQNPRLDNLSHLNTVAPARDRSDSFDTKPLPFIRPADIYKRIPEEREKERRSQDSARPSIDSGTGRIVSSPSHSEETSASKPLHASGDEPVKSKEMKPILETLTERKSEYGLNSDIEGSALPGSFPEANKPFPYQRTDSIPQHVSRPQAASRQASSVYTDQQDPTSASSTGPNPFFTTTSSTRSPTVESPQHMSYQYSPSTNKLSGLRTNQAVDETVDDLPNFDHGYSPQQSMSSSTHRPTNDELKVRTNPPENQLDSNQHRPPAVNKSAVQGAIIADSHPLLPSTNRSDTPQRSDTGSTTGVSPIIEKAPGLAHEPAPGQVAQTQKEEIPAPHVHDKSATTSTDSTDYQDNTILPASTFVPGAYRKHSPPVAEGHSERQSTGVQTPNAAQVQQGALPSTAAPSIATQNLAQQTLPATQYDPSIEQRSQLVQPTSHPDLAPPLTSRSASQDWQEWQAQRRQFNAKHGIEDSNTASPALSTPISRAESPAKGTVRDITDRLESHSGRSSPAISTAVEGKNLTANKPTNVRNDSFRPALPGGWNSYTTNTSMNDTTNSSQRFSSSPVPPRLQDHARSDSTDSVPTATAPRQWQSSQSGPVETAFAAAAAAGNAMIGAFSGSAFTKGTGQSSEVTSDEDDLSDSDQQRAPDFSETRDFAPSTPKPQTQPVSSREPVAGPVGQPESLGTGSTAKEPLKNVDLPAPLRTSRSGESRQSSPRRSVLTTISQEDNDEDPDKLQEDIVQSLTPRTSTFGGFDEKKIQTPTRSTESNQGLHRHVSIISHDGDFLPHEYASYWQNQSVLDRSEHMRKMSTDSASPIVSRPPIPETAPVTSPDRSAQPEMFPSDSTDRGAAGFPALATTMVKHDTQSAQLGALPTGKSDPVAPKSIIPGANPTRDDTQPEHFSRFPTAKLESGTTRPPIPGTATTTGEPRQAEVGSPSTDRNLPITSNPPIPTFQQGRSSLDQTKPPSTRPPIPGAILVGDDARSERSAKLVEDTTSSVPRSSVPETTQLRADKPLVQSARSSIEHTRSNTTNPLPHSSDQSGRSSTEKATPLPAGSRVADSTPNRDNHNKARPPFLDTRYSWEAAPVDNDEVAEPLSPDSSTDVRNERPPTPKEAKIAPPSTMSPPTSLAPRLPDERPITPEVSSANTTPTRKRSVAPSSFPQARVEFRSILALKDPMQRVRAFDENRRAYAEPNGLLEQWLTSMNTPEHSGVFQASRLPRTQTIVAPNEPRPSPRRDVTAQSGTKQMQEDGKRFLAAAGKYSGKAGTVAKGFFARSKDKFRSTSSGEKVQPPARRRSSIVEVNKTPLPRPQESVLPERAPQLPTPSLETPPGEPTWSTLSTKIDQMFEERPYQPNTKVYGADTANAQKSFGNRGLLGHQPAPPTFNRDQYRTGPNSMGSGRPPASIPAPIPGSNNIPSQSEQFPSFETGTEANKQAASAAFAGQPGHVAMRSTDNSSKIDPETDQQGGRRRLDSLSVPRQRRPSSISDVSDVSTGPDEANSVIQRNVSPALESQSRGQGPPSMISQRVSKDEEALQDKNRLGQSEGTLPAYNNARQSTSTKRQSRIEPGAKIVPVADLSSKENGTLQDRQAGSRPFSFIGSETLNHALSQQAGLASKPSVVTESPADSRDRVDIEKAPQPKITEHPAYRDDDQSRLSSEPENPLPSARRTPQVAGDSRQSQQAAVLKPDKSEEGYRIPGPYVQEYRSPRASKPALSPDPSPNLRHSPDGSTHAASVQDGPFQHPPRPDLSDIPSAIESRHDSNHNRSHTHSGMMSQGSRSPSQSGFGRPTGSPAQGSQYTPDEGKKRKGFFGFSNRSSSPSHQLNEGGSDRPSSQDPGQGRKLSTDILRLSGFGSKPQTDTKKKRSSGFGALFGKSSSKENDHPKLERRGSLPLSQGPQPTYGGQPQPYNQSQYPMSAVEPRITDRSDTRNPFPAYQQGSVPAGGQFPAPTSAYSDPQGHFRPGEQRVNQAQQSTTNWVPAPAPYGNMSHYENLSNSAPAATSPLHNDYQAPLKSQGLPVPSAPPVLGTYASQDVGYGQDRSSIGLSSTRLQNPAPQMESKPVIAEHVKNLHKRSRSPRLGRPPSDEHLHSDYNAQSSTQSSRQGATADPASQLGMFNNKRISPGGGVQRSDEEQEKPWTIGLPDGGEDETSESDASRRIRDPRIESSQIGRAITGPPSISPTTPHSSVQHHPIGEIVSPIAAVEPRGHGLAHNIHAANTEAPRTGFSQAQPQQRISNDGRSDDMTTRNPITHSAVTPSTSIAPQIFDLTPQPLGNMPKPAGDVTHNLAQPSPSTQSQVSRGAKQALIERTPEPSLTAQSSAQRPQTVAERVMGIQPAARGTVSEHQPNTSVTRSPSSAIGSQSKSASWADTNPSPTAASSANNGGTTVTTTTMRSGSKLGQRNLPSSTSAIDPDISSKSNSNALSASNRNSVGPAAGASTTGARPLSVNTSASNGNYNVHPTNSSRFSGAPNQNTHQGKQFAVELPGSRPDGYESEEDVVMSATAYPGQEWMPEFGHASNWDD